MKTLCALSLFTTQFFTSQGWANAVPLTWEEHLQLGEAAYSRQDFEEAISHFEKAELESDSPHTLYYNRGMAHRALSENEQAMEMFRKSMEAERSPLTYKPNSDGNAHFDLAQTPSDNTLQWDEGLRNQLFLPRSIDIGR